MLTEIAQRTFEALRQGTIRLDVRHRYPLAAAAQAHRDLESRTHDRTADPAPLKHRFRANAASRLR